MLCNKCGNVLPDGTQVCHYCGNNLNPSFTQIENNNQGFTKKQKTIILSLLMMIIILLSITAAFLVSSEEEIQTLDDGSRTIMIYMVGSNLETDSQIATSDLAAINPESINLEKINILLYTGGTKEWHNFIQNDENAIYQLKEDGFEKIQTYNQKNMGDYQTFLDFLNYGSENYETQYYDLILYDHGGAIQGAIYDDFTNDNLSLTEFNEALKKSNFSEKNKLNTVLFRTCLNGTIEVANTFASYAEYLIASEEITHGKTGESVLKFLNDIDETDDGISYGKKYIQSYEEQIENIDPLGFSTTPMYSIIDLSKIENVNNLLSDFISSIDLNKNYKDIVKMRSSLYQYGYTTYSQDIYDTVDLYTLVNKLSAYTTKDNKKLLSAIEEAIVYNWSEEENSNGLSIYFPYNASQSYQKMFLLIYKNLATGSNSYYKFIGEFNNLSTSNELTSFSKTNITESETVVNDKEFSLQLTEEQQSDYADSIYIIFRKDEDGLYNPIYSSNNTEITSDGLLKTNISNNLIKLYDKTDPSDNGVFLTLVERGSAEKRLLTTTAVLNNFSSDLVSEWKTVVATTYFEITDNVPKVSNYIELNSENGASGSVLNPNDFTYIYYSASSYKILDENGNYTSEWDNNGIISSYEIELDNVGLKMASLDENEEYFCVFKIQDIYGNSYYSKLLSIK